MRGASFLALCVLFVLQGALAQTTITTCQELQNIGSTGNYVLANDIDCQETRTWNDGAGFAPLGGLFFSGSLAGNGHTIFNLFIYRPATDNVGLFRSVDSAGEISSLRLENVNITGNVIVGGLAAYSAGRLSDIFVSGEVSGLRYIGGVAGWNDVSGTQGTVTHSITTCSAFGETSVGGLVGWNQAYIADSTTSGEVAGSRSIGGLVGHNHRLVGDVRYAIIVNCAATGTVSASGDYAGGLVGYNEKGNITQSMASGNVTSTGWYAGGLVGRSTGTVAYALATGTVLAQWYAGGLIGSLTNTPLEPLETIVAYTYSTGRAAGSVAGGLIGAGGANALVFASYWDVETSGRTTSSAGVGRTTEQMHQQATYLYWDFNCTWQIENGVDYPTLSGEKCHHVNVTSCEQLQGAALSLDRSIHLLRDIDCSETATWNEGAGFLPGALLSGTFRGNGHTLSHLTIHRPLMRYIGLFDHLDPSATVTDLILKDVLIVGDAFVGGLAGFNRGGTINRTTVTGTILGETNNIGGLLGSNDQGHIFACTADTNTSSQGDHVGGLVGYSFRGSIQGNTSGYVSGNHRVGGLLGYGFNFPSITNSHAAATVSGNQNVGGLIGYSQSLVSYSAATGGVSGVLHVGGLIGASYGSIDSSCATGSVDASEQNAGGLIGFSTASVTFSFATGNVTADNTAGGLLGSQTYNSPITQSFSTGTVIAKKIAGSLVGATEPYAIITDAYAVGCVQGKSAGALAGSLLDDAQVIRTFWDKITTSHRFASGTSKNHALRDNGKETAELYRRATFPHYNFSSEWDNREDESYPFLLVTPLVVIPTARLDCPEESLSFLWIDDLAIILTACSGLVVLVASARFFSTFCRALRADVDLSGRLLGSASPSDKSILTHKERAIHIVAFVLEAADRVFDCYFAQELDQNREHHLAAISIGFLAATFAVSYLGLIWINFYGVKSGARHVSIFLSVPVAYPELANLIWEKQIIKVFAKLKILGLLIDDVPQFAISIVYTLRKGANTIVIIKLVVALVISILGLIKLWLYDVKRYQSKAASK